MTFTDKVVAITEGAQVIGRCIADCFRRESAPFYLASDKARFITGDNICIDGDMTRDIIYHNYFEWRMGY